MPTPATIVSLSALLAHILVTKHCNLQIQTKALAGQQVCQDDGSQVVLLNPFEDVMVIKEVEEATGAWVKV